MPQEPKWIRHWLQADWPLKSPDTRFDCVKLLGRLIFAQSQCILEQELSEASIRVSAYRDDEISICFTNTKTSPSAFECTVIVKAHGTDASKVDLSVESQWKSTAHSLADLDISSQWKNACSGLSLGEYMHAQTMSQHASYPFSLHDISHWSVDYVCNQVFKNTKTLFELLRLKFMEPWLLAMKNTQEQPAVAVPVVVASSSVKPDKEEPPMIPAQTFPAQMYRPPWSVGDRDLDPLGPLRPPSAGGGMLVGPDHPMFSQPFGSGEPSFMPPEGPWSGPQRLPPGAVPPGARFDPITGGPLAGQPGFPGRMPPRPRPPPPSGPLGPRGPPSGEPDPDEAPPPGYNDMFW